MDAILTRRSIRKYTNEPVSDELVTRLLKAAMAAPTAGNRPWHFVVIRDRAKMEAVTQYHPHANMLKSAPVTISISGDPDAGSMQGRWLLDCCAATENILIAANALGLGACWVGIYPVEERMQGVREILGIPANLMPVSMTALGHPAEHKEPSDRFMPDRIHYDTW